MSGTTSCFRISDHAIDPELFIGYESGNIAMFKIALEEKNLIGENQLKFKNEKLFSAQKFI